MRLTTLTIIVTLCWAITTGTNSAHARSGLITQASPVDLTADAVQQVNDQEQSDRSDRRKGDYVEPRDQSDRTPLTLAAGRNDLAAAKDLLARGADVNAKDADGYTVLMYAAFYGNAEIVELLLDNGAEVNARDNRGLSALMEAAKQYMDAGDVIADYEGTVRALLKKGADPDPRDKDGSTALLYAEKYGLRNRQEIVKMLKNAGAKQ